MFNYIHFQQLNFRHTNIYKTLLMVSLVSSGYNNMGVIDMIRSFHWCKLFTSGVYSTFNPLPHTSKKIFELLERKKRKKE